MHSSSDLMPKNELISISHTIFGIQMLQDMYGKICCKGSYKENFQVVFLKIFLLCGFDIRLALELTLRIVMSTKSYILRIRTTKRTYTITLLQHVGYIK